jgi:hypothetical protein
MLQTSVLEENDYLANEYNPTNGVSTLSCWWSLSVPETLRAMPAVAWLLFGAPVPDRSRGRSQTKRDTLVLQVGGWT